MKVKMILPALTEASGPYWRPIKYSLFPPLGLLTLAAYLSDSDEIEICDEHTQKLNLDDRPDLVVIQAYITSAYRAYTIADSYRSKGVYVAIGGLHPTALPDEVKQHCDSVFTGPGEDTFPQFLRDFRNGEPKPFYRSTQRDLTDSPVPRRDLLKRELYLAPNSIVVSRGCPHSCDFCYKDGFYRGGKSFYTAQLDRSIAEIDAMPGRHLFFLDDNIFGSPAYASSLFDAIKGMNRVWQAAGTVAGILNEPLIEKAAESGLRSLFVGFETLSAANLRSYNKLQNLNREYTEAIRRLHSLGVMVNASFVFGMDGDDPDVFKRTVEWAINNGIETATFHILTPYPGTALYDRMVRENRMVSTNWDDYDTRHVVFRPAGMTAEQLQDGYRQAYRDFYSWSSILRSAGAHDSLTDKARHLIYSAGWKKFEFLWAPIIKLKLVQKALPILEEVLSMPDRRKALKSKLALKPEGGKVWVER